ncbi:MAG: hypothetical protein A2176_04200 [Spirochaetes bacterium RBG_13_51_14]|nr:MAG: hypothetical protein A2176_04200 [Spirochaetes bacterium RBG_13_51_14]
MNDFLLPRMYRIRQEFHFPSEADVPAAVRRELGGLGLGAAIRAGDTIAVTAGSRGIADIRAVLTTVVEELLKLGARPFIVPAMGSHGGATARGQLDALQLLGITEATVGCPIRSAMETISLGEVEPGVPVLLDRNAAEADHIAVINRVKPHTRFTAPAESGLVKMCLIGLGKAEGARVFHRAIDRHGWRNISGPAFSIFAEKAPLLFGLALLENADKKIGAMMGLLPSQFTSEEPKLLSRALSIMAFVPFRDIDLLIVDEMGKDISGTGMDTNVTGRKDGLSSIARHVFVRDLTTGSGGNALGIGLADFTTRRLVDKIDYEALYVNARTAYRTDACKIPMVLESDRDAIMTSAAMAGADNPDSFRVVWIKNTLELGEMLVSDALLDDTKEHSSLKVLNGPHEIKFDSNGNLIPASP